MSQWWPLHQLRLRTTRLPERARGVLQHRWSQRTATIRLRLDRQTRESMHAVPVTISGLAACLPMLGAAAGGCDAG